MTKEERRQKEEDERLRREDVLKRIKIHRLKKIHGSITKTVSMVKYVIGRYNPQNQSYSYQQTKGWGSQLEYAVLYDSPQVIDLPKTPKGCRYSTSKVFVKTTLVYIKDREYYPRSYIDRITLTNPNHYEMLSAVINNI